MKRIEFLLDGLTAGTLPTYSLVFPDLTHAAGPTVIHYTG